MVKVDLHVHTKYSKDSFIPVKDAILQAKAKGLDGIAITDHDSISAIKKAQKIARELKFLIIPGEEISTKDGHVLALGISRLIPKGLSVEDTIKRIHKQGGIAIASHPYGFILHRKSVKDKIKNLDFDAVEVFNALNILENKKAIKVANEENLVQVAGSDAHFITEIGRTCTIADCNCNVKSFLKKIKEGDVLWMGKRTPLSNEFRYILRRIYSLFAKEKPLQKCEYR